MQRIGCLPCQPTGVRKTEYENYLAALQGTVKFPLEAFDISLAMKDIMIAPDLSLELNGS